MTTTIYITRHGQTEWNVEKRMQGWSDSPLTELGIQQAKWLEERLKDTKLDVIYSSPINRALSTANIVNSKRNIPIYTDLRLKEINMGIWEGLTQDEIQKSYSKELYNFWNVPELYKPYNGETFYQIRQRTEEFIKEIISKNIGKDILIVTHTITLKSIMCFFQNTLIEDFWGPPYIHPTSLTVVRAENQNFKVLLNADTSHLKDLKEVKAI
jgi:probable phosphoglycerate mutase